MRIFDRGLKYKQNPMSLKDAQLTEQMRWQLQAHLLGLPRADGDGPGPLQRHLRELRAAGPLARQAHDHADLHEHRGRAAPRASSRAARSYFAKFNLDGLLRGDYKTRAEGDATLVRAGIINRNEARGHFDLQPGPGPREVYLAELNLGAVAEDGTITGPDTGAAAETQARPAGGGGTPRSRPNPSRRRPPCSRRSRRDAVACIRRRCERDRAKGRPEEETIAFAAEQARPTGRGLPGRRACLRLGRLRRRRRSRVTRPPSWQRRRRERDVSERKWYEIKAEGRRRPRSTSTSRSARTSSARASPRRTSAPSSPPSTSPSIALHVNSPGGSVFDGQAIYNAVRRHPAQVTSYVDGVAASIASVVALAGDHVVMARNALFMIHDPFAPLCGTAADAPQDGRGPRPGGGDDHWAPTARRPAGRPRRSPRAMADETWFSAQEALEFGFVRRGRRAAARRRQLRPLRLRLPAPAGAGDRRAAAGRDRRRRRVPTGSPACTGAAADRAHGRRGQGPAGGSCSPRDRFARLYAGRTIAMKSQVRLPGARGQGQGPAGPGRGHPRPARRGRQRPRAQARRADAADGRDPRPRGDRRRDEGRRARRAARDRRAAASASTGAGQAADEAAMADFRHYLKTGEIRDASLSTTDANGGYIVPEPAHAELIEKVRKADPIFGNATLFRLHRRHRHPAPLQERPRRRRERGRDRRPAPSRTRRPSPARR